MAITYLLVVDGPSDRALPPILDWLLSDTFPRFVFEAKWLDPRDIPKPPKNEAHHPLTRKIQYGLKAFNDINLIFVHRDAEKQDRDTRLREIKQAMDQIELCYVPVIPIRMTEAWLLIDEKAIRFAADNPNGKQKLTLPKVSDLETESDPKETLYDLLKQASGLKGRRLKDFSPQTRIHTIAKHIEDFSPLLALSAIQALKRDLQQLSLSDTGCQLS